MTIYNGLELRLRGVCFSSFILLVLLSTCLVACFCCRGKSKWLNVKIAGIVVNLGEAPIMNAMNNLNSRRVYDEVGAGLVFINS